MVPVTVLAFYLFAVSAIGAGLLVALARNPVHSVLWLILAFFSSVGLFVLMGAEFVAMLLAIVYVGAVAVLFLFVVMMLDVDFAELRGGMARYLPLGLLIGLILLLELGLVIGHWTFSGSANDLREAVTPPADQVHNTEALGQVIYTDFIYLFQVAGLVLLVAMIGAIVLTLRHRPHVKRQDIPSQILRDPRESLELVDVPSGKGLDQ